MKRTVILAAALTLVLSLAACGNRDAGNQTPNNQPNSSGTVENGGSTNGTNGANSTNGANGTVNGTGGTNGTASGSTGSSLTDPSGSVGSKPAENGTDAGTNSTDGSGAGSGMDSRSRSSVGNDLRRAADDVGDAVTGLMDDGRSALTRATSATTFERMLDNARVHDTDGVLTDGENSRW